MQSIGGGVTLGTISGVAVDGIGNVFIADTSNNRIAEIDTAGNGNVLLSLSSLTLNAPQAVAVDVLGNVYVANTLANQALLISPDIDPSILAGQPSFSLNKSAVGFGHVSFGSVTPVSLSLPFTVGGTAIGAVKVFTSGTQSLDFTVTTDGCTGMSNTACAEAIRFLPTAPGFRKGAVVLYDSSTPQNPILTIPLYGWSDAPLAALAPNTASVINTGGVTLPFPFQLALDGAGNIYDANDGGTLIRIPAGGGSASVVSLSGYTFGGQVTGVALDGAGNLFISDHVNSRILVETPGGVASLLSINGLATALGFPTALAFDGAGNLYISDYTEGRVIKVSSLSVAGSTSMGLGTVIGTGAYTTTANGVTGVAVDTIGNIYIPDGYQGADPSRILKVTAAGVVSLLTPAGITFSHPRGVGVDGMGNLYVADGGNNRIVAITTAGVASVLAINGLSSPATLGSPFGVTVDPLGNLYLPDSGNNRALFSNVSGSALAFPTTATGATSAAKTATVTNLGNQTLVFSTNPTYTANFSNYSGDTNPCTSSTSLAAGTPCDVSVDFTPLSVGSLSAGITVTDNTLNVAGSTQQVSVSGTSFSAGDTTATTVAIAPSTLKNGQTATLTASVADTTTGHTATVPTGSVSFTDTVGSTVVSLGTATLSAGVGSKTGVQLSGIGSHTITVSYAGVSGTFLTSSVTATVALSKAPVTLVGPATQPVLVTKGQAGSAVITLSGPYTTIAVPSGTLSYSILNASSVSVASGAPALLAGTGSSTVTIPIPGTLASGAYTISATYSGDSNYLPSSAPTTVAVSVSAIVPTISWTPGATSIIYGATLANILNATAQNGSTTVPGTFAYSATAADASPVAVLPGTILAAGTYTVTATFTPTDPITYAVAHASITLVVTKATATITWNPGATSITYGAGLSNILNATAANGTTTVAGTFAYAAATANASPNAVLAGTILAGGTYTLTATFTPTDATDFAAAPSSITLVVTRATAAISWTPGATSLTYGASLSSILNATAVNGSATVAGTFAYTATASGASPFAVVAATILPAGSYTLTLTFTPTDSSDFAAATSSATLVISKAAAAISFTSSSGTVAPGNAIIFTSAVSNAAGTPTGSVSFFDGTTLLATVALSGGTAAYSTSSLAAGAHSITATYTGDNNFAASTSSAIVETVQDFNLTLAPTSPGGATQTAVPGGTAIYDLAVGPTGGTTFPASITLAVSGLPPGATATITPQILPAGSQLTNVVLTIQLPQTTASLAGGDALRRSLAPMLLGILVLPFTLKTRRPGSRSGGRVCVRLLLMAGMMAGLVAGLSGCGSSSSGFFGHPQQSYSVIITATSGTISHTTTVALIVE